MMTATSFIKASALKPGETIGIVAPSSPQRDDERLKSGARFLESLGYSVKFGSRVWNRYGYLAGTDQERLQDVNDMIRDPDVRMIVAGRGGYGSTRILDGIDYESLKKRPTILVGFSDVTALNCAALAQSGLVTFSGAMPGVDLWKETPNEFAVASLLDEVTGARKPGPVPMPDDAPPIRNLHPGHSEGWLFPANLTLLANLCGTPWMPDPSGAILVIEEIGEEAYRVDRLLSQLWNAGILKRIEGLVIGAFTGTEPKRISIEPLPIEEVFEEYVRRSGVPTIAGIPYGHIEQKLTLPFGIHSRIDADSGRLELLEPGVQT